MEMFSEDDGLNRAWTRLLLLQFVTIEVIGWSQYYPFMFILWADIMLLQGVGDISFRRMSKTNVFSTRVLWKHCHFLYLQCLSEMLHVFKLMRMIS